MQISNDVFTDRTLSLKALGLFCKLYASGPKFEYRKEGMAKLLPDGKSLVASAFDELIQKGYVRRISERISGKFSVGIAELYEEPFGWDINRGNQIPLEDAEYAPHTENRYTVTISETQSQSLQQLERALPHTDSSETEKPSPEKPSPENRTLLNTKDTSELKDSILKEDGAEKPAPLPSRYDGPEYDHLRPPLPNLKNPQPAIDPLVLLDGCFPGARPSETTAALVKRIVLDTRLWTDVLQGWKAKRHNPENVEGMVDRYIRTAKRIGERDDRGIIINRVDRVEGLH